MLLWPSAAFVAATAVIFVTGGRLPVTGGVLAERTGVRATTFGLFVLAVITSLPELSVTLGAMLREKAPDLALGNVLGSNNFNVAVIALLELAFADGILVASIDRRRYSRTCLLLLAMTLMTGAGIVWGRGIEAPWLAPLLFTVPIVAIFVFELATERVPVVEELREKPEPTPRSTGALATEFLALSAAVIAAGFVLSWSANQIAEYEFAGNVALGQTFVGTVLVAVATSLPEVTVAFAAVRRTGSGDMAIGTLLGSNSFNILIFALGAPLMLAGSGVSAWQLVSRLSGVNVLAALVLTAVVLSALSATALHRTELRARLITGMLIPVYLVTLWLVRRGGW